MPRLQPERWVILLVTILPFTLVVLVGLWQAFADRPRIAILGALGGGIALLLLNLVVLAAHDTRVMLLRGQFPDAVVVNIRRDPRLMPSLAAARDTVIDSSGVGGMLSLLVDRDGLTFYKGAGRPELVATIPWSIVGEIEPGLALAKGAWGSAGYERLAVKLIGEAGGRVEFGVERISHFPSSYPSMGEAELVLLAGRMNEQRGRKPVAAPTGAFKGLDSGPTAWSLTRLGILPISALGWVSQGIFAIGIVAILMRWPLTVMWVCIAVSLTVIGLMILRLRAVGRAAEREKTAGYTTLNGVNLAVEQRHPHTGVVIRAAGAPALSKQEFAALLAR